MKKNKITSIALATLAVTGISLLTQNADAQWRTSWGWGQRTSHGPSCSSRVNLRGDVYAIDRLANQMAYQFSREMNYRCSCSVELLNHLRKNAALTRNLVTAVNGSCKCTFEKAACALNTHQACVVKQSRKVRNLSCSMKGSIDQSANLARRIHKNANQFVPRGGYTSHRSAPAHSPVHVTPNRHGHGHNPNTAQQDPLASLIFSLFNR